MATQIDRGGKKLFRLPLPHAHGVPMANAGGAPGVAPAASAPTPAEIAGQIEALNRTFEEFKAANDARLAEVAKGKPDVITNEKVDRINASVTEIDQTVRAMSEQIKIASIIGAGEHREGLSPEARKYGETFADWVRGRKDDHALKAAGAVPGAFQAAMSTQSDPDGGFLLPQPVIGAMTRVLGTVSAMRSVADVITVSGGGYKKPHNLGGATSGWVTETGTRSNTSNPTISELNFPVFEVYAQPLATQALLDDSATDVESWLGAEVAMQFADKEAAAFISGDGAVQPMGIKSYTMVANASYAWGKTGYVVTGVAAALSDNTYSGGDNLINLYHALKQGYRNGAAFMMNDATLAVVRKFKDANDVYLWQPGLTAGEPSTLLGKSAVVDDNMPDVGAGLFPIAFGDFKRGYLIVDRIGVRVLRDPYTSKPYIKFYTTKRVGGGIQDFAAIKFMKCST